MGKGRVENLRTPTTEEAREIGRMGGIASGKARKAKKARREFISDVLENPLGKKQKEAAERILGELEPEEATVFAMVTAGLIKAAVAGNTRAFELLMEYSESGLADTNEEEMDELTKSLMELGKKL